MKCPRCGNEWDVSMSPCTRCGLLIRLPARGEITGRPDVLPQQQKFPTGEVKPPQPVRLKPANMSTTELRRSISSPEQSPSLIRGPLSGRLNGPLSGPLNNPSISGINLSIPTLPPGTLLHAGRYSLQKLQHVQELSMDVSEITWSARDMQRTGAPVIIRELSAMGRTAKKVAQSVSYAATMALTAINGQTHVPALLDAFSDQERSFFVFEYVDGYSLQSLMRRAGNVLPEQDVVECCLQMIEVLDILYRQSPPLVHGYIRPEYIFRERFGALYTLTNFSIVLAGGATQLFQGVEHAQLSAYAAPELSQGIADTRTDLYALLATMYHAVTGVVPGSQGSASQVQRRPVRIAQRLDSIFLKGLSANIEHRYQSPAALRHDLLELREIYGYRATGPRIAARRQVGAQAQFANSASKQQERSVLVPLPEELPPLEDAPDLRNAVLLFLFLLLCMLPLLIARGIM